MPVTLLNFAWHRLEWPPVERLAGSAFDVVHAMHPLLIPSRDAARLVTIHDLDFLDHPERTRGEIRRDYPALAARHARRADHIVTVSRHTARAIETRLGVEASRISICYPGAPSWAARAAEPDRGCVLFLGSLVPRKNLGTLLDAYEQLIARMPTAPPLVLAGGQSPESEPMVARTRRPPLAGRVELTGYVPPAERPAVYRRALVFVMPSYTEGFGMPVIEAMTCGVPVIAANGGALPETVGDAGRLFDSGDAAALARNLEQLLTDPAERRRLSEAGRAHAKQFSWAAAATGVRDAWTRAIDARSARRG